jgi:glutamate-1-semialdehyde 2,1-aminomutase
VTSDALQNELLERAWHVLPGGISSARRRTSPPLVVSRASGGQVEDAAGRRYTDFHQAYSAVFLGHAHERVVDAVASASREVVLTGVGVTPGEVTLAERLVELYPSADQVIFANSGSEATYNAIRLARAVTGREKILKFAGCYHGSHDYVLRNARSLQATPAQEQEYAGVLRAASESVLVARYNDLDDVSEVLARWSGQVAAIIVEPIAHNAPNIMPAPGFLEGLRTLTEDHGALLIFDEMITGFRHALGGYQEISGVAPDLTTIGKAMANGYSLAALLGPREFTERFATHPYGDVFLGGTYNGNVTGVAAALATIGVIEEEPVHEHVFALGDRMRAGLAEVASEAGVEAIVSGYGSIYTLMFMDGELTSDDDVTRADDELFVRYRSELFARGILEMPVPFVRAQVGYAHTTEDVDRALEAASDALAAALDRRGTASGARPR